MASYEDEFTLHDLDGGDPFNPKACVMIAAIDFGTTYSGYGLSFKNKPHQIQVNNNWGEEFGILSHKTPTTVLIDGNRKFVSFGYTAEYNYSELCDNGEGDDHDLFRHFKMALYTTKTLSKSTQIESTKGRSHLAIDIFAMALRYLKHHLLEVIDKQTVSPPDEDEIQWVLTIPAIWSDKAKQFMREAAFQAGLIQYKDSKQLIFALEPEAASVCCRNLEFKQSSEESEENNDLDFPPGTKYMIIDAGGGTIDITAHEIQENGDLVELMCATGGDWGGNQVNQNFENYITDILGQDFINVYRKECSSQWLSLMNDFEIKKRKVNIGEGETISIILAWSLFEKYNKVTSKDLPTELKKASSKGLSFRDGTIVMNAETARGFFTPVVDNIVNHIQEQLQDDNMEDLEYILLVGGFSDSKFLFQRIEREFSSRCTVLSPESASLSIIKGAVLFGHKTEVIAARRVRKTYGYAVEKLFQEGLHDPKKASIDEFGDKRCTDIFMVFATKGELVNFNTSKTFLNCANKSYYTTNTNELNLYCTDSSNVMYVDEPGVAWIGKLEIKLPFLPGITTKDIQIETRVYFGQTEMVIEAENKSIEDGEVANTSINFLGD